MKLPFIISLVLYLIHPVASLASSVAMNTKVTHSEAKSTKMSSKQAIDTKEKLVIYRHSSMTTPKDIHWMNHIDIGEINLITKDLKPSAKMPAHFHQHFTVIATVMQGEVAIQYGRNYTEKLILSTGDSFAIPPGICHINANASSTNTAQVRISYLIEKNKKMQNVSCPKGSEIDGIIDNH